MHELCDPRVAGIDAVGALVLKRTVSLNGRVIGEPTFHHDNDGLVRVTCVDEEGQSYTFQFEPSMASFADTAIDNDGRPVCSLS